MLLLYLHGDTKMCVGCFASFANCVSTWNNSIVLSLDQLSLNDELVLEIDRDLSPLPRVYTLSGTRQLSCLLTLNHFHVAYHVHTILPKGSATR